MNPPSPPASHSSRLSSSSEADDASLKASIDALLADEPPSSSPSFPRSSSPHAPSSSHRLSALAALFLFSTLAAWTLPHAALQNRAAVLFLPPAQFLALALVGLYLSWRTPRGMFEGVGIGMGQVVEEERKLVAAVGALNAAAALLVLWEARWLDGKVWEALEVFVIPFLILIPPLLATYIPTPPRLSSSSSLTYIAITFLVGFSLIGIPAHGFGLCLAVLKLPLEAARWYLLRQGLAGDKPGGFLFTSTFTALGVSSFILFLSFFLPFDTSTPTFTPYDLFSLLAHTAFSTLEQISLLATLFFFSTPFTAAATILPRNIFLLILGTFGRHGIEVQGNWAQMMLVLIAGTVGVVWNDAELADLFVDRTRYFRSRISGRPYEQPVHLPSHSRSTSSQLSFSQPASPDSPFKRRPLYSLALLPFLPLLISFLQSPSTTTSLVAACAFLLSSFQSTLCYPLSDAPHSDTVDLVFAYYAEPLERFKDHVEKMRKGKFVKWKSNKVLVYNKGLKTEKELRQALNLRRSDEVIPLPNVGREGGTYLQHILLHYNASITALATAYTTDTPTRNGPRVLADHTFFLQPHLAWDWIAQPMIELVEADTGFQHFGPMMKSMCGEDTRGNITFPLVKELYNIFVGQLCPPEGHLSAWSGQFVVSKRRILANDYHRYDALDKLLEAPAGHWIHNMWGPNESGGPSNPALGHSVERAWPFIFGCSDVRIADECTDAVAEKEKCQCAD